VSRGRRLELGGFGAFGGAFLAMLYPWAGIAYALALIVVGCVLQWRAERRQASPLKVIQDGVPLAGREREEALQQFIGAATADVAGQRQDGGEA